jgi:hypothetical protein
MAMYKNNEYVIKFMIFCVKIPQLIVIAPASRAILCTLHDCGGGICKLYGSYYLAVLFPTWTYVYNVVEYEDNVQQRNNWPNYVLIKPSF